MYIFGLYDSYDPSLREQIIYSSYNSIPKCSCCANKTKIQLPFLCPNYYLLVFNCNFTIFTFPTNSNLELGLSGELCGGQLHIQLLKWQKLKMTLVIRQCPVCKGQRLTRKIINHPCYYVSINKCPIGELVLPSAKKKLIGWWLAGKQ